MIGVDSLRVDVLFHVTKSLCEFVVLVYFLVHGKVGKLVILMEQERLHLGLPSFKGI